MTGIDFSDVEWDDDEGGEESSQGFNTITEQNNAVNQPAATQQATTVHVDPEPVTYRDTTDPQKKKEMFLASKGIPGPYSRSMREGKWDKYLINPKTGNSVFSEHEARQASRGGWDVPTNGEGVRKLAESIRADIPEVGEELVSLIMNDPQRARKAIANGKLTQAQAKRAYDLMDKVYAYNKTKQWVKDAEDFSQTYPMRPEEPRPPKKETARQTEDTEERPSIFDGYEYLTDTINGKKLPPKMRANAMKMVEETLGAAMAINSKRGISGDIGKWDRNARRMLDNALESLGRQSTKTKSGKVAYTMANRLVANKYVEARINRFARDNNADYTEIVNMLGEDGLKDLAFEALGVGRKNGRTLLREFDKYKPMDKNGPDSWLRNAVSEKLGTMGSESIPAQTPAQTNRPVVSDEGTNNGRTSTGTSSNEKRLYRAAKDKAIEASKQSGEWPILEMYNAVGSKIKDERGKKTFNTMINSIRKTIEEHPERADDVNFICSKIMNRTKMDWDEFVAKQRKKGMFLPSITQIKKDPRLIGINIDSEGPDEKPIENVQTEEVQEQPAASESAPEPPKPRTFGDLIDGDTTEIREMLNLMSMYKNSLIEFQPRWDKMLSAFKREGVRIPKKLEYDNVIELCKKKKWDINSILDVIERVNVKV